LAPPAQAATHPAAADDQPAWDPTEQADARPDLAPLGEDAKRWAMLSYLGVPFLSFVLPLAIYLAKLRSAFIRRHSAQALNLSLTVLLYNVSALILGGLLALDDVTVAVVIVAPLLTALWAAALVYLIRAASAASRGEYLAIPGWLCATLAR
jgi:uncharacterized Tic20 family protein